NQRNNENRLPAPRTTESPANSQLKLSKSRTHGVLSSITSSLSRASLSSHTNSGFRNFSGSSSTSGTTTTTTSSTTTAAINPAPRSSRLSISLFGRKSLDPAAEKRYRSSPDFPIRKDSQIPSDPRLVTMAMPPEYWTGRFTTLHDRDHNQLLECRNLNLIVDAHVVRSSLCSNTTTGSHQSPPAASTWNNPSTSVYANKRVGMKHLDNYQPSSSGHGHSQNSSIRRPSLIPHSATSSAILETPRRYVKRDHSTPRVQPPPRLPSYDQAISRPVVSHFPRRSTLPGNESGVGKKLFSRKSEDLRAIAAAEAANLTDDESRCLRVFAKLEGYCVTAEALISFRSWQQDFARSTKRDVLLPEGGTMGG
ncbi:hypothetical protein B0T25DRAFT_419350, partial [Lasiosphaeria hispida]